MSYTYDALDRLTAADYGSAHSALSYDYAGRKTGLDDDDMGLWSYVYDASSNLTGQTDARGCVTSLTYDLLNRPTGKSYSGSCGVTTAGATYSYDSYSPANAQWGRGQRTGMTDGSGSTSWRYNTRGRLRLESKTISGSGTFVSEWSYNSAGLVSWMKYPGGNGGQQGEQVNFTYLPQRLVKTATGAATYVKNATYDAAGRADILELGLNGSQSYMYLDYNYYAWNVQGGRLQWLQANQTAGYLPRQKLEYAYDAAGNVDWIKDHLAGSPYQLQDFSYDLLNRLDAASASGGDGQGLYNERYDYDSQGNLWKKGTVNQETVYTYLDSNHKHAVTHLGGTQKYWYDLNGNMSTRTVGTTTYSQGWDAENRLVSVSGTGVSAAFSYDGDGVRVKGTLNGTVTAYVGNWFEWSGSTSTMKKYYEAGSQRIAMRTGSGTGTSGLLWVIGDHLGSTTKIANPDGSINSQRRYKPWGEARYGGALPTTFRYTGQRQEDQLGGTDGLYYYGARWLDPALGRWLSPDSIVPEAAQGVQAWSRYTYVNNAPTRYQDPTGHSVDCAVGEPGCEAGNLPTIPNPVIPSFYRRNPNFVRAVVITPQDLTSPNLLEPTCTVPPTIIGPWDGPGGDLNPLHPDYVTIAASAGAPGFPAGVAGTLTVDRYSNVYVGVGVNLGKSYITGLAGSVNGGWIGGNPMDSLVPSELDTQSFLTGLAVNASAGAFTGAGITWAPSSNVIAFETGGYSPQYGVTVIWNWQIVDNR